MNASEVPGWDSPRVPILIHECNLGLLCLCLLAEACNHPCGNWDDIQLISCRGIYQVGTRVIMGSRWVVETMWDPHITCAAKALRPNGHDYDSAAEALQPNGLSVACPAETYESRGARVWLLPRRHIDAQWNRVPYILNTYLKGSGVALRIHIS